MSGGNGHNGSWQWAYDVWTIAAAHLNGWKIEVRYAGADEWVAWDYKSLNGSHDYRVAPPDMGPIVSDETLEERNLLDMLANLQREHHKAAKPYVDRLAAIRQMQSPEKVFVTVEQARQMGFNIPE